MSETKRRAIVWDTIERIAFRPSSNNDCSAWLGVYAKTLHKLWGLESMWNHFGSNDIFDIQFLELKCKYEIENVDKYSVSLQDLSASRSYWQNHIDATYISKASLHSASGRYPRLQRAHLQRDIEAVLDGMLFHPRCHAHLEDIGVRHMQLDQDSGGLSSHEVRIGGGIENPYVFLFHLRYQFCLVADQVRQTERQRLI
ncbi:MAG TPA: hypothetical protein ENI68_05385, partial [Gammaproteobacteria bacterium]|nr:hypothetical protein [Gammaproteobacteria bacterium]